MVKQLVKLCGAWFWSNSTHPEAPVYQRLGIGVLDIKNKSGRSAITEAEINEWAEGVTWMVGVMTLDGGGGASKETDEVVESEDVQVEIQDAEGRIAKLSVKGGQVEEV